MGSGRHSISKNEKRNSFDDNNYSMSDYNTTSNYNTVSETQYNTKDEITNSNFEENENYKTSYLENNESKYEDKYEDKYDSNFWDEEEREFNYKKLLIVIAIIAVIIIAGVLIKKFAFDKKKNTNTTPVVSTPTMSENIAGYKVLGQIKISKLNIEQYILDSTDDTALKNGVGRIDNGASINNYGNFCIAGHNEDAVFAKINELDIGDEIILVDKKMEETTYKITKIYGVEPDNLECLLQDDSKVELTLITCQNGATTRLVVKAEEKDS